MQIFIQKIRTLPLIHWHFSVLTSLRVIILTIFCMSAVRGYASLRVYPVVLEMSAKDKTAQLTVRHSYTTPRWVEVSTVYYDMNSDGSMVERSYEEGVSAKSSAIRMLRFSPKRFQLKPGGAQVLLVRGRLSSSLADGIYRAHLKFTPDEADDVGGANNLTSNIQQQLKARIAIAVPIYLKKGDQVPVVSLGDLKIMSESSQHNISATMKLSGADMVRGDFLAYAVDKSDPKKKVLVGKLLGVASYIDTRKVTIKLLDAFIPFQKDSSKNLELVFKTSEESEEALASASIPLLK